MPQFARVRAMAPRSRRTCPVVPGTLRSRTGETEEGTGSRGPGGLSIPSGSRGSDSHPLITTRGGLSPEASVAQRGPDVKARSPISSLAATLVTAFGLSLLVAIPTLFLPIVELRYFLLPFALFGVGLLAGRSSFIGGLGFAGSLIGGFAGSLLFQYLAWATGWELLIALGLGAAC